MSLKTFLFPSYEDESPVYSTVLLVARIFFGLLFLSHGYDKLMSHSTMAAFYPDPIGVGSFLSFWLTVFAEVVCSFALIFGLLQRIVLIPMIITMCVAFFVVHGGDALQQTEDEGKGTYDLGKDGEPEGVVTRHDPHRRRPRRGGRT